MQEEREEIIRNKDKVQITAELAQEIVELALRGVEEVCHKRRDAKVAIEVEAMIE